MLTRQMYLNLGHNLIGLLHKRKLVSKYASVIEKNSYPQSSVDRGACVRYGRVNADDKCQCWRCSVILDP